MHFSKSSRRSRYRNRLRDVNVVVTIEWDFNIEEFDGDNKTLAVKISIKQCTDESLIPLLGVGECKEDVVIG